MLVGTNSENIINVYVEESGERHPCARVHEKGDTKNPTD